MGEKLDDDRGIFDGRQDGQRAAALGTGGDVDGEHAFEQLGPAHPGPWRSRGGIVVPTGDVCLRGRFAGHDLSTQGGIGREYAMEANEMEARTWDEGGEALEEFQRDKT